MTHIGDLNRALRAVSLSLLLLSGPAAWAQDAPANAAKEPAPPEDVVLHTPDGVTLLATYYPGPKSKQTPPVVLLNDEHATRAVYANLASRLQAAGCSVLAADLRGFGGSTATDNGHRLDGARLPPEEYGNMARYDLEVLRRFLIERNNAGELNLSKLGLLGAGMSAPVALVWAHHDWTVPPLATGKQGQDIHALALISPNWRSGALRSEAALGDPEALRSVAMLVAVGGKTGRHASDAQRLFDALTKVHPGAKGSGARGTADLFQRRYDTTLQGNALLGANVGLEEDVVKFFEARLITPAVDWTSRKRAFDKAPN